MMKRMVPIGNVTAETWQHITRSHGEVNNVVDQAMVLLTLDLANSENQIAKYMTLC